MSLWLPVLGLLAFAYMVIFAIARVASRASRDEELLVHRKQSRVYQLDPTQVALNAYRGRFEGVSDEDAGEGPPWPKDAA